MGDFQVYRDRVANLGKLAAEADNSQRYEEAIDYYTKAVEIFKHMIKCRFFLLKFSYRRTKPQAQGGLQGQGPRLPGKGREAQKVPQVPRGVNQRRRRVLGRPEKKVIFTLHQ